MMGFQEKKEGKTLKKRKYSHTMIICMRFDRQKDVIIMSGGQSEEDNDVIIDDIFSPYV